MYNNLSQVIRVFFVCCFSLIAFNLAAQFTADRIVVLQVGNGTETLGNTGNSMFLKEYTSAGAAGITVAIPNTGASALITAGNSTAEGYPSLSSDGAAIAVSGYNTAVGGAVNLTTSTSAAINRAIALVKFNGTYSLESTTATAFSAANIRSAASDGVDDFWAIGSNTGVAYFGDGTPATVSTTVTNTRALTIQNGQLYFSTGSGTNRGVYKVGTGTPVVSGTVSTIFVNTGASASPYQYAFNAAGTVCYIADDRTIATGGGIQKWTFNGSAWSLAYTMGTVGVSTVGARGLIADFSGANPVIYATTSDAGLNRIIKITDTGTLAGANATAITLVTATTNTAFRGLSFSPECTPVDVVAVSSNSPFCSNEDLELSATVTGTAPFTYLWSGTGTFNPSNTDASPSVSGASAGTYSVTVTNACGSDNGSTNVIVENPVTWYADTDGDGFGNLGSSIQACGTPVGYVVDNTDCNDASATAFPGAIENLCDGIDNNCNGTTDEGRVDGCNDSSATNYNPLATCNNGSCTYTACDGSVGGLQDIIVETYYISDANDATDTNGGSLPEGSTTYRIYVDMAPGYEIQAVYGNGPHTLNISTTTEFFNNLDRGETVGSAIPDNRLDENTVALDSWISMGGASTLRTGVLKTDDSDGSLVGGSNNDGGSAGVAGGLLVNNDPLAGLELTVADGLINGVGPMVTVVGLDVSMFDNLNSATALNSNGGAWSVLEGTQGPDGENRVLVAQITTDGELSFTLNVQLGTPVGGVEQYVWSNPTGAERTCAALTYPQVIVIPGCTDSNACNYDDTATEDDGSCTFPGCIDVAACNYDALAGCDDGSCTYPGCVDVAACNYDALAGCDDGSCTYPGCVDVAACNYNALAGCDDGSCSFPGCTNPTACNYNATAGCDNGSCTFPGCTNATACNYNALAGCDDGSCSFPGCTNPTACSYDATAGCDNGSCTFPGCMNAAACNYNALAGCDDGSCSFPGCTNPTACSYNAAAGCDDGSCTFPGCTNSTACNYNALAGCDDGSCSFPGCTNPTACSYNAAAGCDDGSCTFPGCTNPTACNYNAAAGCDDGSCSFPGCTNPTACNYNAAAGCDNGLCTFPGCTNPTACNYNATAGCNDGSCILPDGCTDPIACNYNALALCDNGTCILPDGCTNPAAFNYDPTALCDDGSCLLPATACDGVLGGLEDVKVEKYYISDANDATDTDGGSLAAGSTTYRVFVDLAPGYELQAVYGNGAHQLNIGTTTQWFNNADRGETSGNQVGQNFLDENTVALDSWIAMSGASNGHLGILKSDDTNGSIVGGVNNDGGSANIPGGLLVNNDPMAGIPLTTSDGLIPGTPPSVTVVGLNVSMFDATNSGVDLVSNGGAYSVLEGVQGPTADNCVLIGQFTTNGDFSFTLNLQLGTPDGGVEQYVWGNPVNAERTCEQLVYPPAVIIPGCTDDTACNYDPAANEDDGSCTYPGCNDDTACNYDALAGCDDGSCTFPGCIDVAACNYDALAGCDDGSCTFPGCTDVTACNYNATAGCDNGSCTFPGCTNPTACNYNAAAGCDNGSCTFPGCVDVAACNYDALAGCDDGSCTYPGCTDVNACNYDMTAGCDDGSCTYPGCTNGIACNYNPLAGCDDGSCFFGGCNDITACNFDPFAGCNDGSCTYPGCIDVSACNYDMTAGCDDGSCTYPGCTDITACNYNALAGCDDGSCIIPDGCTDPTACNYDALALCDDGSCDYVSCLGCTDPTACNYDPTATVDDGSCVTPPCDNAPNDSPSGAIGVAVNALGTCNPVTGDLSDATASGESNVNGADLWYTFVAVTSGARIEVVSSSDNTSIELQDAFGNPVDVEDLVGTDSGEILNIGSLTAGDTYYIAVNSNGAAIGDGTFNICIQWIPDTNCDYGPGPYSLCNTFKLDFVGANGYSLYLTSNTSLITYSKFQNAPTPGTFFVLNTIPNLPWGDTYTALGSTHWNLSNSAGMEMIEVLGDEPCTVIISPQPLAMLRPSDNCANHGPHLLGSTVAAQPFVCGAVNWEWTFTRIDVPELPIVHLRGSSNRFLPLATVPGLTPGGTYDVKVRPIFATAPSVYGPVSCLSIAGPAMFDGGSDDEVIAGNDRLESVESALYPNPNTGEFVNINLTGIESATVIVKITDSFGKLVFNQQYTVEGSLNTVVTFENALASGTYNVSLIAGENVRNERLVVTR